MVSEWIPHATLGVPTDGGWGPEDGGWGPEGGPFGLAVAGPGSRGFRGGRACLVSQLRDLMKSRYIALQCIT